MDRELKFRAWDEKHQKMIYDFHLSKIMAGCFVLFPFEWPVEEVREPLNKYQDPTGHYGLVDFSNFHFQDCVVEQFTGLHDINGTEIYEGDIVFVDRKDRFLSYNEAVIIYQELAAAFMLQYTKPLRPDGLLAGWRITNKDKTVLFDYCTRWPLEVIGNVHEDERDI